MHAAIFSTLLVYAVAEMEPSAPCVRIMPGCWEHVASAVNCFLNPRNSEPECQQPNRTELCSIFENALRCSSEMVDGCDGREKFDFWIRGLEAVNSKLCFEGLMEGIVSSASCWDAVRFSRCVQHSVSDLSHLVDLAHLLQETPDGVNPRQHCHLVMLRMAKCAALAAVKYSGPESTPLCNGDCEALKPGSPEFCTQVAAPVDTINEMLASFFSASECGGSGNGVCQPPQHPELGSPPLPEPGVQEPGVQEPGVQEPDTRTTPPPAPPTPSRCASSASAPAPKLWTVLFILSVIAVKFS